MAGSSKSVELVIRARDESKRAFDSARTALDRFAAAQAKTASRRDFLAGQKQAAREAANAYQEAATATEALGRRLSAAKRPSAALRESFDQAREAARRAKQEFLSVGTAYAQSMGKTGGRGSFAAFDQVASGASRATGSINTATAATMRNTAALNLNAKAGRGPLGLQPFQLANLSYQVNDVVSGLAMGQAPAQILAQQGGQIVQIFPKLGGALLRALPIIGLVAAALSPFLTALQRVNNEAKSLSEFDRLLTRSGEGASYTAAQLASVAEALDDYGGSLADARAALTEFVGDSVAPEYLERFGKTALDFSRVMGVDVKEAAEEVSNAFTGNADAILALDDQVNFLTDSERAHVVALRQSKRDAEARTYAFDIFAQRYGETAEKMRGPWTQILNNFGSAWGAFVDTVNFLDFGKAKANINELMGLIVRLTQMLPGANTATLDAARATFLRNAAEIERLEDAGGGSDNALSGGLQRRNRLATLRSQQTYLQTRIALLNAQQPGQGLLGPTALPTDTTLDPPANANTDSGRDRAAERRAEQQRDFVAGLAAENAERRFALQMIDQEERKRRILEALREKELAAAEVGLTLSTAQRADIEATVGALYDAEKAHEALRLIEQARLDLAEARGEVESRDDFVSRKIREAGLYTGELDAATGELIVSLTREGAEYAGILRTLYDINEATRQRAAAEKEVNDLTALRSTMQDRVEFLRDNGQGAEADILLERMAAIDAAMLRAIDRSIEMWTAIGGPEAERAILALTATRDGVTKIGEHAIVSGRQINEMVAGGVTNAFAQFAQSIGEGANAITSLRDAFLKFAADFLVQISQMILKQTVLNLLQASAPGGGKGGSIAGAINGLFGGGGSGGKGFAPGESAGMPDEWWRKIGGLVRHNGGLVGQGGGYRPVALSAFAGATRYHTGGLAGFKPNEVPAVLTRGEEVLTMDDPRHRRNAGGKQGGSVKVVNVFDPADALERGLATETGERVFLNFVSRNSSAFKAAIR